MIRRADENDERAQSDAPALTKAPMFTIAKSIRYRLEPAACDGVSEEPVGSANPDAAPEEMLMDTVCSTVDVASGVDVCVEDDDELDEENELEELLDHEEEDDDGGGDQVLVGVGLQVVVGGGGDQVDVGEGELELGLASPPPPWDEKNHDPVSTPTDSSAKNLKRPSEKSRPP